jgi:hypothetical protein
MNEHDIDALLAGHALGDLDEAERARLTALLRERPELRQRLEEFRTALELLPLALPEGERPPTRLRRRLLEAGPGPAPGQPLSGGKTRRWPTTPPAWLVPALLGLGLVLMGGELHRTRLQLAALEQRLDAPPSTPLAVARRLPLRALDGSSGRGGEVLVTGNPSHNLLVLDDLPPPPPHHTYRLWATVNGREVGCVHFVPDPGGHVAMAIPSQPTSSATRVSVSLERDPLGKAPQNPYLLKSNS